VETYIVRIYRLDRKNPKKVAGVVEGIGEEGRKGFLGPDSLWKILTAPRRESLRRGEPSRRKRTGKSGMTPTEIMKQIAKELE
jgi:hypothetical protein